MKTRSCAILCILALAGGCKSGPSATGTTTQGTGSTTTQVKPAADETNIGFLHDYSQLQPAPDREGVKLYVDKTADFRPYTKVMFDPVAIYVAPNPEYKGLPSEELNRMGENLLRAYKEALAPAYQIVNEPGPDVLRVRTAITGVQVAKPAKGVTDFIPIKALYNLGREASGNAPRTGEMTAEQEVLDARGKPIAAATATRKASTNLPQGAQLTWQDMDSINRYWAQSFRSRLDELRTAGPGQRSSAG